MERPIVFLGTCTALERRKTKSRESILPAFNMQPVENLDTFHGYVTSRGRGIPKSDLVPAGSPAVLLGANTVMPLGHPVLRGSVWALC